ncbi:RNA-binding protein [Methylobacterium brachythecii]|uniref:DNA-binding protein n=1 Tax=Methylobacterium brachythecii TaxID=1176177 RepID=A0A7W6F995_9HYPH|nr:RNA-binding protein [Methylobacterium brachythecii]MBB3905255.1 hypothetical protein [Methylobacterium brachythecii]GLS45972.1 DNA-binding protein [Methylobacterium brachythecii]
MIEAIDSEVELDPGPGRGRQGAERTCIVTREAKPPRKMIRFVLSPEGQVVPDLRARLPGRGAWVSGTREAVETALKRRLFRRAFKNERADAAPDTADRIAEGMRTDLRQAIAMANKSGCVVMGFGKVEAEIGGRTGVAAVIHASDGAADGRRKIGQALRRRQGDSTYQVPIIDDLSEDELDMALGRDHVIHAALVAGAGTTGCLARWRRLRAFEGAATVFAEAHPAQAGAPASDPHDDETMDRPVDAGLPVDGTMQTPRVGTE